MDNWKQIGAVIATIGGALGLYTQLNKLLVSPAAFERLEARFERHLEIANENVKQRNERWKVLGFDSDEEPPPKPTGAVPQTDRHPPR